jgi:phosphoribosylformylglycinamidine cyclo-ligase
VLPEGSRAVIERSRWEVPHVFEVLQGLGDIPLGDMFRTFNMGIGFTCVVAEADVDTTLAAFDTSDLAAIVIGHVSEGARGVELL